ncbi:MAG: SoxR reducing system RseC family protein [Alkalispirochaeta sp.]
MADIVTVRDREVEPGIALVSVLPPSCGRCETDGGHCDHELREMRVRVPDHLAGTLQNGYRVKLGYSGTAMLRAVGKLLVAPVLVGALFTAGTWRWVETMPAPEVWHGLIAVGSAVGILALMAWRGGSEADLPVISDTLEGVAPELQPVELMPVHR